MEFQTVGPATTSYLCQCLRRHSRRPLSVVRPPRSHLHIPRHFRCRCRRHRKRHHCLHIHHSRHLDRQFQQTTVAACRQENYIFGAASTMDLCNPTQFRDKSGSIQDTGCQGSIPGLSRPFRDKSGSIQDTGRQGSIPGLSRPFRDNCQLYTEG